MQRWISERIEKANWTRFLISFAALMAYSFWLFRPTGRFMQAKASVGKLPEEMFGFPVGEPERAFSQLFGLQSDYMLFQALDIPYAILNFFAYTAIIALALKNFRLQGSPARFLMVLPAIYLVAEFLEDTLLVVLASNGGAAGLLATLQQAMTNLKFAAGFPSAILSLIALIALAILFLTNRLRGKSS